MQSMHSVQPGSMVTATFMILLMPPAEAQAVPRTSRAGPSPSDPARRRGGRSQSNGLGLGPGGGGGMAQAQLA